MRACASNAIVLETTNEIQKLGSVDPWIANANTPPRSPKIGIEEIDHSPLHNRLPPLRLRSMLMRVRQ